MIAASPIINKYDQIIFKRIASWCMAFPSKLKCINLIIICQGRHQIHAKNAEIQKHTNAGIAAVFE